MDLTLDLVSRCERHEPDPGPDPATHYFSEAECLTAARELDGRGPGGQLWLFAYGSLIWKPAFDAAEHRVATAHGWHRSFNLEIRRWRGSPDQPGLMMGLKRGGSCKGVAYRLEGDRVAQLARLLEREVDGPHHLPGVRWVPVMMGRERAMALTFWASPPSFPEFVDYPLEQVAPVLARACGHFGSGAGYLYNTVVKLQEHGIRDRNLWRLQKLVAAEIRARARQAGAGD